MIVAVDFDGTCVDHCYPQIGNEVPGAVSYLKFLQSIDAEIVLFTMRSGKELGEAIEWFKERDIKISVQYSSSQTMWTSSNKCYAEVYIDDAALGCPLIHPSNFRRPCVDWSAVHDLMIKNRAI
jgi:hypothetical protein